MNDCLGCKNEVDCEAGHQRECPDGNLRDNCNLMHKEYESLLHEQVLKDSELREPYKNALEIIKNLQKDKLFIEYKCKGCDDPCILKVKPDEGYPSKCPYGLTSVKCRWDKQSRLCYI